jgi:phosphoribosylamine--glycine ligase
MARFDGCIITLLADTAEGRLNEARKVELADRTALTVVMAANGYPGTPQKGGSITGIETAESAGAVVFQAGTALQDDHLVAAGGRVLAVTATGDSVSAAQAAAYAAVDTIDFPTGFCRRDIGWRAVEREQAANLA